MKATTIGIDLAKHLFQLHGVDQHGKTILKRQLKREQMLSFFSNLPPSLIGMEACGSAHYWANKLQGMGHTVKLMAQQFVKPYVKTNKNDAADAEAICEAVTRPTMRFLPIKSSEQLANPGLASCSTRLHQGQDSSSQPDPGPVSRIRVHPSSRHHPHRQTRSRAAGGQ